MKRGTAFIPNILSMVNLIFGFLSIISTLEGKFTNAAFFILIAALADSADGKIARKFKAVSDVGVEFDSLADLISFGVAGPLLLYAYMFSEINFGIFIPIFLVGCSALRLARFNVEHDPGYFQGLPTPASGFLLAAYVISGIVIDYRVASVLFVLIGMLMVSNIKYPTFKKSTKKTWGLLVLIILFFIGVIYINKIFILLPFFAYLIGGPFILKWSSKK